MALAGGPTIVISLMIWYALETPRTRCKMLHPVLSIGVTFVSIVSHEGVAVAFTSLQGDAFKQSLIALLLPTLKFVVRYFQMRLCINSTEGTGTTLVAFEVQFFNAFYAAAFLQQVSAPSTIAVLLAGDVLENLFFFYEVYDRFKNRNGESKFEVGLKVLFRTEYVLLIELVEVITPLVYGAWVSAMHWSVNRQFVRGFERATQEDYVHAMSNLAIYISVEVATFLAFVCMLTKVYHLPAWQQMEYAVNKYKNIIVTSMSLWSLLVVWGRIEHTGNDYSIQIFNSGS